MPRWYWIAAGVGALLTGGIAYGLSVLVHLARIVTADRGDLLVADLAAVAKALTTVLLSESENPSD